MTAEPRFFRQLNSANGALLGLLCAAGTIAIVGCDSRRPTESEPSPPVPVANGQPNSAGAVAPARGGSAAEAASEALPPVAIPGARHSSAYEDALEAQEKAIDLGKGKLDGEALHRRQLRQLQSRLVELFRSVYFDATRAGVRVGDPTSSVNEINVARKRSGVWEVLPQRAGSDPNFITLNEMGSVSPAFFVEGVGLVVAEGIVRDEAFADGSPFSPSCKYQILVGSATVGHFPCADFLQGNSDGDVFRAMQSALVEQIKKAGIPPH
jgi:hypothetical protein